MAVQSASCLADPLEMWDYLLAGLKVLSEYPMVDLMVCRMAKRWVDQRGMMEYLTAPRKVTMVSPRADHLVCD